MKNNHHQNWFGSFVEFLPLIIFFVIYKLYPANQNLVAATIGLLVSTIIVLIINYLITKKLAFMPLFSAIILGIFGSITIFSGNEIFIKMKPTLLNLLFAAILFFGYFFKKPFLKYIFASKVELSEEAWISLSKRWGLFFIFLAVLNEVIWRNFTTDFWVKFKVFGILIISLIFTLTQLPYMLGSINKSDSKNHESKN